MYIINKDGTENEVVQAYDEYTEEYGYCILCDCCSEPVAFLPECIFLDLMEAGQFEVFVDDEDFEEDICDCDYCCGVRDGVELAMDTMEELDELEDDENECFVDDIRGELFAINEEMVSLRDEGLYEEYAHMANAYNMLYRLIM